MVSHCGFNLYLSDGLVILSIFSFVSGPFVCPPWRSVCSGPLPFLTGLFVFLEWSHVSCLYILEIKPLSEVSLANIFSHMVGSFFIVLMFSLAMQKLYFDEVPFVYSFLYVSCSRGYISENIAAWNILDFLAYILL